MVVASLQITVKETENLQPAVEYMTCNVLKKGAWDKLIFISGKYLFMLTYPMGMGHKNILDLAHLDLILNKKGKPEQGHNCHHKQNVKELLATKVEAMIFSSLVV